MKPNVTVACESLTSPWRVNDGECTGQTSVTRSLHTITAKFGPLYGRQSQTPYTPYDVKRQLYFFVAGFSEIFDGLTGRCKDQELANFIVFLPIANLDDVFTGTVYTKPLYKISLAEKINNNIQASSSLFLS